MPPTREPMSDDVRELVVVGYEHCNLRSVAISHALGYNPKGAPYHSPEQVHIWYHHIRTTGTDTYSRWGPRYQTYSGSDRVSTSQMQRKKGLLLEGHRRADYAVKLAKMEDKEREDRKREWKSLRGHKSSKDWSPEDSKNMRWDALAERRRF